MGSDRQAPRLPEHVEQEAKRILDGAARRLLAEETGGDKASTDTSSENRGDTGLKEED